MIFFEQSNIFPSSEKAVISLYISNNIWKLIYFTDIDIFVENDI